MKKLNSISVFFPCYNDSEPIKQLVLDANALLKKVSKDYEIIVIDDGSTDDSRSILKKLQKSIPNLKLIFHKQNKGYGGALKSGFKNAKKEFVFYTDGDGQYDFNEITKLIDKLTDKIGLVQGYKLKRSDPWFRYWVGLAYRYFSRLVYNIKVKDIDCDFRLIRKKALDKITLKYSSGVICVELMKKLDKQGVRFAEVGVHHYPRLYGNSEFFKIKRVTMTLIESSKLWFNLIIL